MPEAAVPLETRGLTRRFGPITAVDALDLSVRSGEIVGFLGPNGAGKTTTLRLCSGLLKPEHASLDARARLGLVPDRPFLYERLSAREMLELVAALYRVPPALARERGEAMLEALGLGDAADRLIEGYSQGMRQKVAVAAALLHDPPLVMLDEPLSGLDPRAARALKDLLRDRARRGHGVLVSTHLLDVAERLCDRVVFLHHGRKLAEGTLAELRGAGSQATLEDMFLELTREAEAEEPR
jgi:ABC-2 type transport system ATP-binding protein